MHFWHNTFAKLLQYNIGSSKCFYATWERAYYCRRAAFACKITRRAAATAATDCTDTGSSPPCNENLSARCDDFCNAAKLMLEILRLWSAPGSGEQCRANGEANGWRRYGKRMKRTPHRHCNHYNECSVSAKWIIHVVYVPRKTISIVSTQQTKLFNRNRKGVNESLAALQFIC